jgi:hypothetical protein
MQLAWFSDPEAKALADGILAQHGLLQREKLTVNVEILALQMGYPIEPIDGLRSRFDLLGTGYRDLERNKTVIVIDSAHYLKESKSSQFTVAEELAHLLIHGNIFDAFTCIEDRIEYESTLSEDDRQILELQAKKLASALLLPGSLYDPQVLSWCRGNLDSIRRSNPLNEKDLSEYIARQLVSTYGLSTWILDRAMQRPTPEMLVHRIIKEFDITLLDDIPEKRIGKDKIAALKARLQGEERRYALVLQ